MHTLCRCNHIRIYWDTDSQVCCGSGRLYCRRGCHKSPVICVTLVCPICSRNSICDQDLKNSYISHFIIGRENVYLLLSPHQLMVTFFFIATRIFDVINDINQWFPRGAVKIKLGTARKPCPLSEIVLHLIYVKYVDSYLLEANVLQLTHLTKFVTTTIIYKRFVEE